MHSISGMQGRSCSPRGSLQARGSIGFLNISQLSQVIYPVLRLTGIVVLDASVANPGSNDSSDTKHELLKGDQTASN